MTTRPKPQHGPIHDVASLAGVYATFISALTRAEAQHLIEGFPLVYEVANGTLEDAELAYEQPEPEERFPEPKASISLPQFQKLQTLLCNTEFFRKPNCAVRLRKNLRWLEIIALGKTRRSLILNTRATVEYDLSRSAIERHDAAGIAFEQLHPERRHSTDWFKSAEGGRKRATLVLVGFPHGCGSQEMLCARLRKSGLEPATMDHGIAFVETVRETAPYLQRRGGTIILPASVGESHAKPIGCEIRMPDPERDWGMGYYWHSSVCYSSYPFALAVEKEVDIPS